MPTIQLLPATYGNPVQAESLGPAQAALHALTDTLEFRLQEAGIASVRQAVDETHAVIDTSKRGDYDLHLSLYPNLAPDGLSGMLRGITVLHMTGAREGARAAALFTEALNQVYPQPQHVKLEEIEPSEPLAQGKEPFLLLVLGYQDSSADAAWLQYRREEIAVALARAAEMFFSGKPLLSVQEKEAEPSASAALDDAVSATEAARLAAAPEVAPKPDARERTRRPGIARAPFGGLVIRTAPENTAPILATAANHSQLAVLDTVGDWYLLQFGNKTGYASQSLVALL